MGNKEAKPRKEQLEDLYIINTTNKLGRGHYATVWEGKCIRTGRRVAIKKIKKSLTDEKRLRSEISVLQRAGKHENIVELIDVFETPREVQLVLELCSGGELFDRLAEKGPYSEKDCAKHIQAMAKAIQYLHSKNVVHRDLKPENILLSCENDALAIVKVADFGLAKVITGTNLKSKCGTWGYSAPEMVSGSNSYFGYDSKVDSWSLGTILYILLCGYHPFDPQGTRSDNQMMNAIKTCQYDYEDEAWIGVSDTVRHLIGNLLVLDPELRYNMDQVLEHPWIQDTIAIRNSPLSPTIHKSLALFKQNSRDKLVLDEEEQLIE